GLCCILSVKAGIQRHGRIHSRNQGRGGSHAVADDSRDDRVGIKGPTDLTVGVYRDAASFRWLPLSEGASLTTISNTTLHLIPPGSCKSGFGRAKRTPKVPLAASSTWSTTVTVAV